MMKQLSLSILFMALICNVVVSQDSHKDRSKKHKRMKAKKIAYITDALELTPAESEKFWPVYNEFKKAHEALLDKRQPYDKLSDVSEAEAKELLSKSILRDKKKIELKEKYNAKFLACISAKKLVLLPDVERKFRRDILSSIRDRYTSRGNRKN